MNRERLKAKLKAESLKILKGIDEPADEAQLRAAMLEYVDRKFHNMQTADLRDLHRKFYAKTKKIVNMKPRELVEKIASEDGAILAIESDSGSTKLVPGEAWLDLYAEAVEEENSQVLMDTFINI